jgi:hypothetical protein
MLTRLWFVLSLGWAALFFFNCMTRETFRFDQFDAVLVFGPFIVGLLLRWTYRYVRHGVRLRRSS